MLILVSKRYWRGIKEEDVNSYFIMINGARRGQNSAHGSSKGKFAVTSWSADEIKGEKLNDLIK